MRVRWRLPSGKKAIFSVVASQELQARVQSALGVAA
jgi:hypothetical protein